MGSETSKHLPTGLDELFPAGFDASSLVAIIGHEPLAPFDNVIDTILALKVLSAKLMHKASALFLLPLTAAHKEVFNQLEGQKKVILRTIRKFVNFIHAQVESLQDQIVRGNIQVQDVRFADLTYDDETVHSVLLRLSKQCQKLAEAYDAFRGDVKRYYFGKEASKQLVGWLVMAASSLLLIATIAASCGLATPAVLATGAIVAAGCIGGGVVGYLMVSEGEAMRTTCYLEEVAKNLNYISFRLDDMDNAYVKTNRELVLKNIDSVLSLTNLIATRIETMLSETK